MKATRVVAGCLLFGLLFWFSRSSLGGASRPVTKPPVQPGILTGPPVDPPAISGQWFRAVGSGSESYRPFEFHDDPMAGYAGSAAISGRVIAIGFAMTPPPQAITSFVILATIVNDNTEQGLWMNGTNSHGEFLVYSAAPYTGDLINVKLTVSFALTDLTNVPPVWVSPYFKIEPFIIAENEDQAAWYCWNPDDPDPGHNPKGHYYVPTWDFGNIPAGQLVTRPLAFSVSGAGLPPTDPRYAVLISSYTNGTDVLFNRSTSLKISEWLDNLAIDDGSILPPGAESASDVSVFHFVVEEEGYLDFGDAPDPAYPTLLVNNGARHTIVPSVFMGSLIDAEADGQPDAQASGDDTTNLDDEDGVSFAGPLYAGASGTTLVACSVSGYLWAWMDFNANGSWSDSGEMIAGGATVTSGLNAVVFSIPATSFVGKTFARFRFTTMPAVLAPTGPASDGEVEDYQVTIEQMEESTLDFGDAWDSGGIGLSYPTLLVNNGARHAHVPGVFLGAYIDTEPNGQPTPSADGDDNNPPLGMDDEDGVSLPNTLYAGSTAQVTVVASTSGFLNAWVDFNANMSWADPGERVFNQVALAAGTNVLSFPVPMPPQLVSGGPHSRWRFCQSMVPGISYTGLVMDGEVEDHEVRLEAVDFGDAPNSYDTLLSNDGARHRVPSAYWLGPMSPDIEPDGQPNANATGDDLNNTADEDGVSLVSPLIRGTTATVIVVASTSGVLEAFVDWNADGDWAELGEALPSAIIAAGANTITITVPPHAAIGPTFARFRFGSSAVGAWTGLAPDGEVEDYAVTIYQPPPAADVVITNVNLVASPERITVTWRAESNVVYETQQTTNMLDATNLVWTPWGGYVIGPTNWQNDTNLGANVKSYRIAVPFPAP